MDIMTILLAAAAIIGAISFAVLVFFITRILVPLTRTLNDIAEMIAMIEKELEGITTETTLLLDKTNDLLADVNNKVSKLDNVFYGVDEVGAMFYKLTHTINRFSANVTNVSSEDIDKTTRAVKLGSGILNLAKKNKY